MSHLTDDILHHGVLLVVLPFLTAQHKHVYVQDSCQRHDADMMLDGVIEDGEEIKRRRRKKKRSKDTHAFAEGKHLSCHLFILKTEMIEIMEENHAACG